ncbi:MAG TPA: transcriptional repressor [Conexibacter sp.]|jgi:Fur family ferric uptake transcriptional regulator|nr:transcriptional repressor [Conexibacter sp.]
MTRTHRAPPVDAPDLDSALDALREQGMRASAARRLVLGALYAVDTPLTAEQIAGGLAGRLPRSDPASVYRNLEVLERAGLVRHVHLGHGPGRYARAGGPQHEYLLCDECGAVRALEPAALDPVRDVIRRELGHEARFTHFPLTGLCSDCAQAAANPRR